MDTQTDRQRRTVTNTDTDQTHGHTDTHLPVQVFIFASRVNPFKQEQTSFEMTLPDPDTKLSVISRAHNCSQSLIIGHIRSGSTRYNMTN